MSVFCRNCPHLFLCIRRLTASITHSSYSQRDERCSLSPWDLEVIHIFLFQWFIFIFTCSVFSEPLPKTLAQLHANSHEQCFPQVRNTLAQQASRAWKRVIWPPFFLSPLNLVLSKRKGPHIKDGPWSREFVNGISWNMLDSCVWFSSALARTQ